MDNLTHSLIGLAAAKAGLERLSPGATTLCVIAANAPDADILARTGGSWSYLHHHRGITHSIVGTLALALLIPALFYLGDQILARLRRAPPRVKFRGLLLASLITTATHPLMDWTNNYGVRPLLPWRGQWFYGDLIFILDPWLWLVLGGAAFLLTARDNWRIALWTVLALVLTAAILFLPQRRPDVSFPVISRALWLAGLIGLVAAHRWGLARRYGRAVALAALAFVVIYSGALSLLHRRALGETQVVASNLASGYGETLIRTAAMPTLANPLRWQGMAETDRATYRFFLSLDKDEREFAGRVRFEKPQQGGAARAVERAKEDERAGIFLEFARFPVFQVQGDCASQVLVQLADLRYTEPGTTQRGSFALELPVACPEQQTGVPDTK
ncbi:MAG TPA: metal-dependent hydrolase [Pyrinomonadaceae bacterium]|jgi:inner membrane protein|nr:metal-dependent hydrolase [Pyrinomonadaceae bacterium]